MLKLIKFRKPLSDFGSIGIDNFIKEKISKTKTQFYLSIHIKYSLRLYLLTIRKVKSF